MAGMSRNNTYMQTILVLDRRKLKLNDDAQTQIPKKDPYQWVRDLDDAFRTIAKHRRKLKAYYVHFAGGFKGADDLGHLVSKWFNRNYDDETALTLHQIEASCDNCKLQCEQKTDNIPCGSYERKK